MWQKCVIKGIKIVKRRGTIVMWTDCVIEGIKKLLWKKKCHNCNETGMCDIRKKKRKSYSYNVTWLCDRKHKKLLGKDKSQL